MQHLRSACNAHPLARHVSRTTTLALPANQSMELSSISLSQLALPDVPTKDFSKTLLLQLAILALQHAWYALAVQLTVSSAARGLSSQGDLALTLVQLASTLLL